MSSAPPTLEEASIGATVATVDPLDFKKAHRTRPAFPTSDFLNRLPPHSIEAEQGILGCVMLSYRESLDACSRIPSPEAFYDLSHRTIYEAMVAMDQNRVAIDVITLQSHLKAIDQLETVGGLSKLVELSDCVPSAANISYYLGIVLEDYAKRRVIQIATDCIASAYDSTDTGLLVDEFERNALSIRGNSMREDRTNQAVLSDLIDDLQQEARGIFKGVIGTGLHDFDRHYRGFSAGDLVYVAARPSVGKTNMLIELALNMADQQQLSVGFLSLEMTHQQVIRRMVANRAAFDLRKISHAGPQDSQRIAISAGKLSKVPIQVCDLSAMTIRQISSKARKWVSEFGIKTLFVDYVQLAKGSSKRAREDRRLEVEEISAGLKAISKDLGIVVVSAAQLNRQVEMRATNSRPRMSDLKECSALEQDADWIIFLWNGKQEDDAADDQNICVTASIAKNRNGPTGDIELIHHKPTGRFLPKSEDNNESYNTHP